MERQNASQLASSLQMQNTVFRSESLRAMERTATLFAKNNKLLKDEFLLKDDPHDKVKSSSLLSIIQIAIAPLTIRKHCIITDEWIRQWRKKTKTSQFYWFQRKACFE